MIRPKCQYCFRKSAAVNYRKNSKVYYRKLCDQCVRQNRQPRNPVPLWYRSGYKLKDRCEKCNFRSRAEGQISVWFIDGNENNAHWSNLKSICANCQIELGSKPWPWSSMGPQPDF
jgi:hypothetical protein